MDNNNPAEMSNQDLENDMQQNSAETTKGNQEHVQKSSAAEGTLKTPEQDESSKINLNTVYKGDEEQDLDDLVHTQAAEEVAHEGNMPDPEALDSWETNDDDINKISS
ncbi:MAG: hypothetical protein JWR18_3480 [Segetibacter sp.]|jgi:hypothetical protein|nr:hypothetical protein [Segetibacter sp.]